MKPINTSIFDFPTLLAKRCVYVDKTAQIYELVKPSADGIYFFPRPRRFGKSLLISTLKALFQGRRELFRGLAIEKADWDWEHEVYPVLHLDMSVVAARAVSCAELRLAFRRREPARPLRRRQLQPRLGRPHDRRREVRAGGCLMRKDPTVM